MSAVSRSRPSPQHTLTTRICPGGQAFKQFSICPQTALSRALRPRLVLYLSCHATQSVGMTRDYRPATRTSIKNAKSRLTASPVSDRGERAQSIIFPFSSARLVRLLLRKRLVNGSFGGDSSLFP